jgi:hypothetical protein
MFRFMRDELDKLAEEEFAPGIPSKEEKGQLPSIKKPTEWEFGVHAHSAARAKEHFDLRLGNPSTGQAHSWALRHFPKPGETRLAVQQPLHSVKYMDFKGTIPSGYGKGEVELARRSKTEVLHSSPEHVRFNVYEGKGSEEFLLKKTKGDKWIARNVTPTRETKDLPDSKPKYRTTKPEKIDTDKPETILQAKIDGAHVLYDFDRPGSQSRTFSYRPTKRTSGVIEHTHRVPGFEQHRVPNELRGTLLRGELYAADSDGKALSPARVGGILNASVLKSRQKQKTEGVVTPVAFDVVRYKGHDVTDRPYRDRLQMLDSALKAAPWIKKPRTATTPEEKKKLIEDIRTGKEPSTEEGVVEWKLDSTAPPTKAKFQEEQDVYVKDIFPEKREGLAGGFSFSKTKGGPTVGRASGGMSHTMKRDMLSNPDKYKGLQTRITSLRTGKGYAPRNASFKSFHLDQDVVEGTKMASDKFGFMAEEFEKLAALSHKEKIERFRSHPPSLGQELLHGTTLGAVGGGLLGAGIGGAAFGARKIPAMALLGGTTGALVGLGGTAVERAIMNRVVPKGGVKIPESIGKYATMTAELEKLANIDPPDISIGESEGRGRGVFAERDFEPDEVIEEAPLLSMPKKQIRDGEVLRDYAFNLKDKKTMSVVVLGYGSIYNHSYEPNARYDKNMEEKKFVYAAIKPIKKGEEIFVNYNHEPDDKSRLWFDSKEG